MNERRILRTAILSFWTLFWGLSVLDKIIPGVHFLWVGKDFFALFVKFFGSLGISDPLFPTLALAGVSALEAVNFTFHAVTMVRHIQRNEYATDYWFFRAILTSTALFTLFSIADQVFGDRFQLLEHSLFWIILIGTWWVFNALHKESNEKREFPQRRMFRRSLVLGIALTLAVCVSVSGFSSRTFFKVNAPVVGIEVVEGIYKFDFPFLADKRVLESTIASFRENHPDLEITYIYTGPSELNSKKKTHLLLYVFTE
ncbi:MAG: hypothetical protein CL845_07170 [Crocinitomicaceae bacterium]|nr:hypothetical protein [Crocinitomicaceae bacterium]